MKGHRAERVGDLIRAELARLLREEVRDPQVGFVTVNDVRLSPDLRQARVWVTAIGTPREETMDALRRATPFLRRGLARAADLRFTPELRFDWDETIERGIRVEGLLREIRADGDTETDD